MIKRTKKEVADVIEHFIDGAGGQWAWDNFCSLRIGDPELGESEFFRVEIMANARHQYNQILRAMRAQQANLNTDAQRGVVDFSEEQDAELESWRHDLPS